MTGLGAGPLLLAAEEGVEGHVGDLHDLEPANTRIMLDYELSKQRIEE